MSGQAGTKLRTASSRGNHVQKQSRTSLPGEHPQMELQRSLGNQAVLRLMRSSPMRPKLPLAETEEERGGRLQAEAEGDTGFQVSPRMKSHIASLRPGGQQMPGSLRAYFEPRLGHDLGDVRLHTSAQAAKAAQAINAKAFAVGSDVFFGPGQYAPEMASGKELLTHELTHVIRQNGGTEGWLLQRQAGTDYGLKLASSRDKYVAEAIKLWLQNQSMKVEDFADALMQKIKTDLLSQGVPEVNWKMNPGLGVVGRFDNQTWLVEIDPTAFSENQVTTVQDLSRDEVKEIAGTLYHESRHIEQDVLVIRVLLQQKKTVPEIVQEAKYPDKIVKAVQKAKFPTAPDKAQVEHANRLFAGMYGEHKELITFLVNESASVGQLQSLAGAGDAAALTAAAPAIQKLTDWAKDVLQPKLKNLAAAKNAGSTERQMLKDLGKLNDETKKLVAKFATASKIASPTAAKLKPLNQQASAWWAAVYAAYQNVESEKDALAVEKLVKNAIGKGMQGKSPAKPPASP